MSSLVFTKMNGAGNDFVMLDNRAGTIALSREQIARVCDRHRGVGADGLILVEHGDEEEFRMRYYNNDGGEAEMCGNGARCFARFAASLTAGCEDGLVFETPAGKIRAALLPDGHVRLGMSQPTTFVAARDLEVDGVIYSVWSINTGVPHAVIEVPDLECVDVPRLGSSLRYHPSFAPAGTNVNFLQIVRADAGHIRTYERGVE
ncbi:MAG: diaminopimelate epimerase, partial [Verrucomicrobiia bacterium]